MEGPGNVIYYGPYITNINFSLVTVKMLPPGPTAGPVCGCPGGRHSHRTGPGQWVPGEQGQVRTGVAY